MIFKLRNSEYCNFGEVVVNNIEDLRKLQFDNEHNLRNDELIINFEDMTIMIYDGYIE